MNYPKNQVVNFDTPKLGLGLFKKNYLGRFLELKEWARVFHVNRVVELFLNLNYHIIYSYQIGIISNASPFSINQK
jgi:hypothetical protein